MAWRFGLGPVFFVECRTNARRWQLFALRTLAAALPGIVLFLVCWATLHGRPVTVSNLASTGERFFFALVGTQLALILLAAPAYSAGAICLDKERGTLLHILVTDLSDTEIILGKLGVRLLAVLGLVFAVVPVLFGAILLGGIDPAAAVGVLVISLGVAVWTSTLALTLSVWMRKTYEVLLVVYLLLVLLLLWVPVWKIFENALRISPPPDAMLMTNPFWLAYLPYLRPGASCLGEQAQFLAVALAFSALMAIVAVLRVRRVALRQSARPQRRKYRFSLWRGLPGPSLDFNPVLWREWHRKRSSRWSLFAWTVYLILALVFSLIAISQLSSGYGRERVLAILANAFQVSVGLLLLSVGSVTALAEERVRGSLDILLTTPLSTLKILQGKWWAAFRPVLLLTVLPGMIALAAVSSSPQPMEMKLFGCWLLIGLILAYGAAQTSLGLALAIWIARPGRAQVVSVMVLVLALVAPIPLLILGNRRDMEYFAQVSPFFQMGQLTMTLVEPQYSFGNYGREEKILIWSFAWLIFYLGVAVLLFVLSLATFDSRLGRASQTSSRRVHAGHP